MSKMGLATDLPAAKEHRTASAASDMAVSASPPDSNQGHVRSMRDDFTSKASMFFQP